MDDEINIKEDITEIVEYIKWENVSLSLLFEFIMKYGKNISSEDIEHIFVQAFEHKARGSNTGNNSPTTTSANSNSQEVNKFFLKNVMEELISKVLNYHINFQ